MYGRKVIHASGRDELLARAKHFAAGSIGLLRFPDTLSRLHALTKADTLGFGLVVAGLALRAGSLLEVAQMLLIWLLVLASGATACQLLARQREDQGAAGERDDD